MRIQTQFSILTILSFLLSQKPKNVVSFFLYFRSAASSLGHAFFLYHFLRNILDDILSIFFSMTCTYFDYQSRVYQVTHTSLVSRFNSLTWLRFEPVSVSTPILDSTISFFLSAWVSSSTSCIQVTQTLLSVTVTQSSSMNNHLTYLACIRLHVKNTSIHATKKINNKHDFQQSMHKLYPLAWDQLHRPTNRRFFFSTPGCEIYQKKTWSVT